MSGLFITGIGTGVGKTVVSAILAEKLQWAYWKPIQTGPERDRSVVASLLTHGEQRVHHETFQFSEPISPHAAATLENTVISISAILQNRPEGSLIVEGAGGVLTPLNDRETMTDLMIALQLPVIVVSRHYVGSINHTLLTLEALFRRDILVNGLVFVGPETPSTESMILENSKVACLGRVEFMTELNRENVIKSSERIQL